MECCSQFRRLLEGAKGNFFIKRMDWQTKGEAQLDILVNNEEDVVGNMVTRISLGCSKDELLEVKSLKGVNKLSSRPTHSEDW